MFYFITIKTRFNTPIFIIDGYFNIVKNSVNFYSTKYNFKTISFILMPDHLHWLINVPNNLGKGFSNPLPTNGLNLSS